MASFERTLRTLLSSKFCFFWMICTVFMKGYTVSAQGNDWIEAEYTIVEQMPPNTVVGNLSAHPHFRDQTNPDQASHQFSFLPQSSQFQQLFTIEGKYGLLRTNSVIDRDETCARSMTCDMMLDVAVINPNREFQIMKVTVHIEDINDNAPSFPSDTLELSISETAVAGVSFVLPQAWDPDSGKYGVQSYKLNTPTDKFSLNVSLGTDGTVDLRLLLQARLDREMQAGYTLEVVATDGGTPALTGTITVDVKVMDANDNSPVFEQPSYEVRVREDTSVGDVILRVLANDPDHGSNSEVVYSLASPTPNSNPGLRVFGIRNATGEIILNKMLDYEKQTAYHLLVTAKDKGPDGIPTQAKVVVMVEDVNDHAPDIVVNALTATGNAEIPENSEPGVFVAHVSIEDKDSGPSGEVSCQLSTGPFELRELYRNVYKVIATSTFDSEIQDTYTLTLACRDGGEPPLSTSRDITVSILDKNDHAPVFNQEIYSATLRENNSIGQHVVRVNATDADAGENARITYVIRGDQSNSFRIGLNTGIVATATVIDFETMHHARFEVIAYDHGDPPRSSTATVVLNIVDINDEPPRFYHSSYSFSVVENSAAGTELGAVGATDRDSEPYNEIVYYFSQNNQDTQPFSINEISGQISTTKVLDREYKPSYTLTVFASNPGYAKMTSSVTVTILVTDINDNAPTILFPNNTSNTVNVPYGAPEGFVFSKIVAMDVDAGANAKLLYSIAKTSAEEAFEIDQSSGAVSIKSHDLWTMGEFFDLLITVSDQGTPPKTSLAEMNIIVNKSIIYPGLKDIYPEGGDAAGGTTAQSIKLNHNQTVLISLGIVTVLLVTILIVAIILVRRRKYKDDEDNNSENTHNQNNFLKIQPSVTVKESAPADNETLPESDSQESGVYSEESGEKGLRDVKFINNISGGILVSNGPQVTMVNHQIQKGGDGDSGCYFVSQPWSDARHPNPQENTWQRLQQQGLPRSNSPAHSRHLEDNARNDAGESYPLTQKQLEAHQFLSQSVPHPHPLPQAELPDSDSASGCSAEVSTTDSGRGPSEDGDAMAPPGVENRSDEMNHHAAAQGKSVLEEAHVQGRTPGRGSRAGNRPPTGTKVSQHDHVPEVHHLHHSHHRHHQQKPSYSSKPNSEYYPQSKQKSGSNLQTKHAAGPVEPPQRNSKPGHRALQMQQPHGKQKWRDPRKNFHGGQSKGLSVSEKPPLPPRSTEPKVKSNSYHDRDSAAAPVVTYQRPLNERLSSDPSSGKLLIWERFRDHAGSAPLTQMPQTRPLSSVQETTTQDEMSDDASTTSGSYVLDLDDVRRRDLVVSGRDSFV